jgi:hypothetical protein
MKLVAPELESRLEEMVLVKVNAILAAATVGSLVSEAMIVYPVFPPETEGVLWPEEVRWETTTCLLVPSQPTYIVAPAMLLLPIPKAAQPLAELVTVKVAKADVLLAVAVTQIALLEVQNEDLAILASVLEVEVGLELKANEKLP